MTATLAGAMLAPAAAGTTGGLAGRVFDAGSGNGIRGATVSIASPSQSASTRTDANGAFSFISLAPDTYVVSVSAESYDPFSQAGVVVLADQVQTLRLGANKTIRTIARVSARGGDLVRAGTTSDVYSINPALQAASQTLTGAGSLNQSYGAVASVPGTNVAQGQQGWYQTVSIRGGDIDQVGYELDGIPVNRAYDNAPQTMLSSLGQQELQVYTGGTPASADASGIAGYINQVIKTGTSPGFLNVNVAAGSPAQYQKISAEVGGKYGNLSYYVGAAQATQYYRYLDQFNGPLSTNPQFFYPIAIPSNNGFVWDGSGTPTFAPGNSYAFDYTVDHEFIANLHYSIPHGNLKDDVQFLFLSSQLLGYYYSSINDLGGPSIVNGATNGGNPITWQDGYLYAGQVFAPVNPNAVQQYFFPSSTNTPRSFNAPLPDNQQDGNSNGVNITKVQYQHAFNDRSFVRLYGYDLYSTWFINGPLSAFLPYGAELADYEIPNHTFGLNMSYTNQLNAQNLLNASVSWTTTKLERYSTTGGFPGATQGTGNAGSISNWIDANGNCYDPGTGLYASCFNNAIRGNFGSPTLPVTAPAGSPGVVNGAQWIITENGNHANLNNVTPYFSAFSVSDQFRPNDKLNVNLGVRIENYAYRLVDESAGYPARPFWFEAYNRENCFAAGLAAPISATIDPNTGVATCPSGTTHTDLTLSSPGSVSSTVWQPRLGATYALNADTVVRASFGVYARPEDSSWIQYGTTQQNLASFLGNQFLTYGFNSPYHDIRPDISYNYDASLEYHLHDTDVSLKVTPFLRTTKYQLQNFNINALTGLFSGLNVGQQQSTGVEFALRKGDFVKQGFSGQLSYTYTHSTIQYNNFANSSSNIIDNLNQYIQQYNSYTSACGSANANANQCGKNNPLNASNSAPCFDLSGNPLTTCAPNVSIANPYYNAAPAPLLYRNARYTTYDIIPGPFSGANGYATPDVVSLLLNYNYRKFSISPNLTYTSGASYGSPLVWPGYVPQGCTGTLAGSTAADPTKCTGSGPSPFGLPYLFIPDKYTGNFDNLGAFKQPQRITVNATLAYAATKNVKLLVALTGLVDSCIQRGYAWDNPKTCVYAQLPSSILAPAGNYVTTNVPLQLAYPYGIWSNNSNTGFVGTTIPFQAVFEAQFHL